MFSLALVSVETLEAAQEFLPTVKWQVLCGLAAVAGVSGKNLPAPKESPHR